MAFELKVVQVPGYIVQFRYADILYIDPDELWDRDFHIHDDMAFIHKGACRKDTWDNT